MTDTTYEIKVTREEAVDSLQYDELPNSHFHEFAETVIALYDERALYTLIGERLRAGWKPVNRQYAWFWSQPPTGPGVGNNVQMDDAEATVFAGRPFVSEPQ